MGANKLTPLTSLVPLYRPLLPWWWFKGAEVVALAPLMSNLSVSLAPFSTSDSFSTGRRHARGYHPVGSHIKGIIICCWEDDDDDVAPGMGMWWTKGKGGMSERSSGDEGIKNPSDPDDGSKEERGGSKGSSMDSGGN
ncbi:hypothetical protein Bca52824_009067 [Brassica carinata]|uniref:Uncharacterized protein n=1 Tax=Brassica carinata TaxID=52824 RepID=A0A8X7W980_BRACI|nr:hypothetical protein Bca52824_009067 [Brassica carinata]